MSECYLPGGPHPGWPSVCLSDLNEGLTMKFTEQSPPAGQVEAEAPLQTSLSAAPCQGCCHREYERQGQLSNLLQG